MANVKPVPDGYHTLTPYLVMKGAARAIEFYKNVFGAIVTVHMPGPGGQVMHAELKIGDSILMLADENPQTGVLAPQSPSASGCGINVYLPDVDAVVQKAVEAGGKIVRPLKNQFYGDRSAMLIDPFGHIWSVATHIEDVSPEEMRKRMAAAQTAGA